MIADKGCAERGCPMYEECDGGVNMIEDNGLKEAVKEFFNKYLNRVEESDSGYPFHPVSVSCCRAMMLEPLGQLLEKMRELSGADKDTLKVYYNE